MNLRQRTVHYYEVVLKSWTRLENIKNPGCCDLRDLLHKVKRGDVKDLKLDGHHQLTVELADWGASTSTGTYAALINRADANTSDVTLRDLRTRTVRKAGKQRHEGIESSAHVLIAPYDDGRRALVLMTMGAGVSMVTLEKLFREISKVVFADPANDFLNLFNDPAGGKEADGSPKKYRVHHSFEILAHKGQVLDQALKSGRFASMELVAHEFKNFDAGGNLHITQQSVFVKAGNPGAITAGSLIQAVRSHVKGDAAHQFEKVKIHYKNDVGDNASATFDINDLDAAFTKRESIRFDTDVEAQQNSISRTVMDQMLLLPR